MYFNHNKKVIWLVTILLYSGENDLPFIQKEYDLVM